MKIKTPGRYKGQFEQTKYQACTNICFQTETGSDMSQKGSVLHHKREESLLSRRNGGAFSAAVEIFYRSVTVADIRMRETLVSPTSGWLPEPEGMAIYGDTKQRFDNR